MTHGLASTYTNHGCRCDKCRLAASKARQDWIKRARIEKGLCLLCGKKPPATTNYCDACNRRHAETKKKWRLGKKA